MIPEFAPFDVIRLVYLGLVRDVCALLNSNYFKEEGFNDHDASMLKERVSLGARMAEIKPLVSWARYPRNIEQYIKGFKAEELSNFVIHHLLPLSFNRVSQPTYCTLQRLVLLAILRRYL